MSRLDAAMTRFNKAVERLEAAAVDRATRGREVSGLHAQITELKGERNRLVEDLNASRSECDHLGTLNERASERLAGTIEGVRQVLAEG